MEADRLNMDEGRGGDGNVSHEGGAKGDEGASIPNVPAVM